TSRIGSSTRVEATDPQDVALHGGDQARPIQCHLMGELGPVAIRLTAQRAHEPPFPAIAVVEIGDATAGAAGADRGGGAHQERLARSVEGKGLGKVSSVLIRCVDELDASKPIVVAQPERSALVLADRNPSPVSACRHLDTKEEVVGFHWQEGRYSREA